MKISGPSAISYVRQEKDLEDDNKSADTNSVLTSFDRLSVEKRSFNSEDDLKETIRELIIGLVENGGKV